MGTGFRVIAASHLYGIFHSITSRLTFLITGTILTRIGFQSCVLPKHIGRSNHSKAYKVQLPTLDKNGKRSGMVGLLSIWRQAVGKCTRLSFGGARKMSICEIWVLCRQKCAVSWRYNLSWLQTWWQYRKILGICVALLRGVLVAWRLIQDPAAKVWETIIGLSQREIVSCVSVWYTQVLLRNFSWQKRYTTPTLLCVPTPLELAYYSGLLLLSPSMNWVWSGW